MLIIGKIKKVASDTYWILKQTVQYVRRNTSQVDE